MRGELVVRDLLRTAFPEMPTDDITSDGLPPRALSVPKFVYVTSEGGSATHPTKVEQPTVTVVVYGRGTHSEVGEFADSVTAALLDAWETGTQTEHGYLSRFTIQTLPYEQAIAGIPAGVRRYSSQYGISVRPFE